MWRRPAAGVWRQPAEQDLDRVQQACGAHLPARRSAHVAGPHWWAPFWLFIFIRTAGDLEVDASTRTVSLSYLVAENGPCASGKACEYACLHCLTHLATICTIAAFAGHLQGLSATDVYRYLRAEHDATTVGLLLGLGAAHAGTCDADTSTMLFLHVPSQHPQVLSYGICCQHSRPYSWVMRACERRSSCGRVS